MEPKVILEHSKLKLTYYPEESCILEEWNGYTEFPLFKELLSKVLDFMVEYKAKNLILDTRLHKGLGPEGQKHGVDECTKHAKKHGQMKHAIIVPKDIFSKFSVDNFVKKLDNSTLVVNQYFKEVDDALAWMREN